MATSVLNVLRQNLGKVFLGASLLATSFSQAQGPKPGLAYIGSCTVNGQAHYYYVSLAEATWPDANTTAVNAGGYLATLTSQAENDCVFGHYVAYLNAPGGLGQPSFANSYADGRNPWIGLNDATNENTFTWANGENCNDFKNWDCGFTATGAQTCEPNNVFTAGNSNGEDYVQLLAFAPAGGDPTPGFNGEYGKKNAGKWNDWFNTESQLYLVEFGPSSCDPVIDRGDKGCSHGYYKKGPEKPWTDAGFNRTDKFVITFGVTNNRGVVTANTTLDASLDLKGGGYAQVAKQGTAALLNAGHGFYPYTTVEVTTAVRQMFNLGNASLPNVTVNGKNFAGGTFTTPEGLASYLDKLNNLGCPLNNRGDLTSSTSRELPGGLLAASDNAFAVSGYPNPTKSSFSIQIAGSSTESVTVKVTDMTGRLIEQRTNVPANQVLQIGSTYRAGMYYVEVMQGAAKKQLKMMKQ